MVVPCAVCVFPWRHFFFAGCTASSEAASGFGTPSRRPWCFLCPCSPCSASSTPSRSSRYCLVLVMSFTFSTTGTQAHQRHSTITMPTLQQTLSVSSQECQLVSGSNRTPSRVSQVWSSGRKSSASVWSPLPHLVGEGSGAVCVGTLPVVLERGSEDTSSMITDEYAPPTPTPPFSTETRSSRPRRPCRSSRWW